MEHSTLRNLVYYWTVTSFLVHCKIPDYCNETIYGPGHVMCLNKWSHICDRKVIVEKLGKTTKLFILHAQNDIRQFTAHGNMKRGPNGVQPSAANMNMLVWSEELEQMAQQWASQCRNSSTSLTDENRNTSYYYVNQLVSVYSNLTMIRESESSHPDIQWLVTIRLNWLGQSENVTNSIIDSYRKPEESDYSYYTQMVWAKTEAVGCGYTRMQYETEILDTLVCNYGPGGNIEGEPVYKRGPVLTECDNDTFFSVYYRGLCQKFYYRTTPYIIPPVTSVTALVVYIGFFVFYLCLIYYLWLSQRYGKIKKLTTGTGKLLKINEKEYVLADY